jgi:endodeoxyribonuclease RusA
VEVWFAGSTKDRADVDNILKPIVDAMKGIVFVDDRQVRAVSATVFPTDDAWRIDDNVSEEVIGRLMDTENRAFLIDVYEGLALGGPAPN